MFGFKFGSLGGAGDVMDGGLSEFEVKDYPDGMPEDGDLIRIEGRQMGITAWVLEKLSLVDPLFTFSVSKNFLTLAQGDKKFSVVPAKEIHSFSVGFWHNKMLLVLAVLSGFGSGLALLFGIFTFLFGSGKETISEPSIYGNYTTKTVETAGDPSAMLTMFAVLAIASAVCWFLFKYSQRLEVVATLISEDRVRSKFGIRVKSTVTGDIVDEEQVAEAHARMKAVCKQFSKFY